MKCYYLFLLLFFAACKNAEQPESVKAGKTDSVDKTEFLLIPAFINEDLKRIDSFAGGILQKKEVNGKKDSAFIKPEKFKEYAQQFLSPELDSANFAKNFKEESFADQTTETINFIYTAENPSGNIKKAIVYLKQSSVSDQVTKIYLEKEALIGDTTVKQRLTWHLNHYFIIAENKETAKGFRENSTRKIIWDPSNFSDQ